MIPPATVQQIIETARVEEVIGDFLTLKRRGANYIANCPFHGERTPSFYVSPAKGIYKCFGCGAAGNSVKFVMEHEKLSYPEALRYIAQKYGIEVAEAPAPDGEQLAEQQWHDSLYLINRFAAEHFQRNLFETDEGQSVGLSYFKERHLNEATIRKFGLGYSIERNNALLTEARQKGYQATLLKEVGLIGDRFERDTDFFRARVMFPIHNTSGKVVAFAGRTLLSDKKIPKYVNSPETPIYHKSQVLYGLHLARTAIRRHDECWLVEGYLDVISLVQAGIEHVVASSGTALTQEQIKLIKRYSENIVILYDSDAAGINAALRGIERIIEEELNVRIVLLPIGHDPDSYIYEVGSEAMLQYVAQNAKDFVLFKTDLQWKAVQHDPIKKAALLRDVIRTIAKVTDNIKRALYVRECSRLFDVAEQLIIAEINQLKLTQLQQKKQIDNNSNNPTPKPPPKRQGTDKPPNPLPDEYELMPIEAGDEANYTDWTPHNADVPPLPPSPLDLGAADKLSLSNAKRIDKLEKKMVAWLLEHGQRDMFEGIPAAAYLVFQLQSMPPLRNALCAKIIDAYRQGLENGIVLPMSHFVQHPDDDIAQLCAQITALPHELSANWEKKHGIVLADANFRYKDEIKQMLLRYQLLLINERLEEISTLLQHNNNTAEQADWRLLLTEQKQLQDQRRSIAKELGIEISH